MGLLDQITQMKSQGRNDQEIINELQQQGIPPKEIQDAMSQAQVKKAVSGTQTQGMEQSIMEQPPAPLPQNTQEQEYIPTPQQPMENIPTETTYTQDSDQEMYPKEYSPQEAYDYSPQENYGYSPETNDTGTLIEISEQVFSDKFKKVQKILEALTEFKTLTDTKIKSIEERLKRIESTIDQLQISILDKIGSYGQNLSSIKKEMSMMQDSFGKVINPVLDKKSHRKI